MIKKAMRRAGRRVGDKIFENFSFMLERRSEKEMKFRRSDILEVGRKPAKVFRSVVRRKASAEAFAISNDSYKDKFRR